MNRRIVLFALMLASCTTPPVPTPPPASPALPSGDYVGMNEGAAGSAADRFALPHRVVRRDGVSFPCTMDYCEQRLNFTFDRGVVTGVTRG